MAKSLQQKVVVVTGALGTLGTSVVETLGAAGARVALFDRAPMPAGSADSGARLHLGGIDLADDAACTEAFGRAASHFGGIDALVNIAGGFRWEKIEGGSVETWDRMYAINLRTAVTASYAVLPHLLARGGGHVINVGAAAASQAGAGMGAYAASKAGVARLTEAMDEEFRDRGVHVNAVLPSIIDTPSNRADMPDADASRWVRPSSLAALIEFLLSAAAEAIHGALIPVRGRV